jgi:predicted membrane channel-forming protein YqfA (hemolysin III family)
LKLFLHYLGIVLCPSVCFVMLFVVVFLCLGLFGVFPGFHSLLFTDLVRVSGFPTWLFVTAFIYVVGGIAYATRIPECYWPGKFDIWVSICVFRFQMRSLTGNVLMDVQFNRSKILGR